MIDQRYIALIVEEGIDFYNAILLILVYEEQYELLKLAHTDNFMTFSTGIRNLEERGFVKWHGDDPEEISLRKAGEEKFKKYVGLRKTTTTAKEIQEWIQTWRDIFPEGVNSSGFRYRGDRSECITKMIKFVNTNDYTIEQIFQATRDYVERFSEKGYAFMQQAHYFIKKQGVGSTLNAECEALSERKPIKEGERYGGSIV
jgi:hypothetical protein